MHHDQKVGLALGVLLIGAVAAFFFRNESASTTPVPALQNSQDVNREISEKRLTPYFSEPDGHASSPGPHARPPVNVTAENDFLTGERKLSLPETSAGDGGENIDPFQADRKTAVPTPAPDPIRVGEVAPEKSPDDAYGTAEPGDSIAAAPTSVEASSQFHEVQKGETLSSIAGKYLGSQARYQELFDANRDLLRNPNDLQVGMKLKIPPNRPGTSAGAAVTPAAPSKATESGRTSITEISASSQIAPESVDAVGKEAAPEGAQNAAIAPVKGKFTPSRRRTVPASGNP